MVKVKHPSITSPIDLFLFFFFVFIVGCLEAIQIVLFVVAKFPAYERSSNWFGKANADLIFENNGRNFLGFMIGCQLTVVASFFTVGAITGLSIPPNGRENNIFGISDGAQKFLNFGFHGAVITTIVASITWQYLASAFPIADMNNPITYVLICFALVFEAIGNCHGAWVIRRLFKSATGMQYAEVYVGTP